MEVTGVVLGVGGLAGSFTACLDCFQYVRVGMAYGDDWETALIKINLAWARFSRWGGNLGIPVQNENIRLSQQTLNPYNNLSENDFTLIQKTLGRIYLRFESLQEKSGKWLSKESGSGAGPFSSREAADIETPTLRDVVNKVKSQVATRKRDGSVVQKSLWALYRKQHVTELLEDVTSMITDLERFVQPRTQQQQSLEEFRAMFTPPERLALADLLRDPIIEGDSEGVDDPLRESVGKGIESDAAMVASDNRVGANGLIHQGDFVKSGYVGSFIPSHGPYVAQKNEVTGHGTIAQGHVYGDHRFK